MKDKLLITLGCSYTEGHGCYDFNIFPKDKNIYDTSIDIDILNYQKNKFHELGWPNKLGKKLGYNKILNLGYGGSSTSGNLKWFIQKYNDFDFSKYDVLLIWWLPITYRFSFYNRDLIYNIQTPLKNSDPTNYLNELSKSYFNFIGDIDGDTIREQIFYLKLMINFCELKNINFLWYNHDSYTKKYFKNYPMKYWIGVGGELNSELYEVNPNYYINKSCGHPNENGYEIISEYFYNSIKLNNKHLIKDSNSNKFEWEWDGEPQDYNLEL